MAERTGERLRQSYDAYADYRRLSEKRERDLDLHGIIGDLRRIPADDGRKKAELASYFQTPEGSRHTREERHRAYIDLLGENENRKRIG